MGPYPTPLPKMMLGFVVRRCTVALGRRPTAAEFASWANGGSVHLFGRAITEAEAALILRHQARLVTAKGAAPAEQYAPVDDIAPPNVLPLAALRARRLSR